MAYKDLPPLTDPDGECRELTAEDFSWAVKSQDFSDQTSVMQFLRDRSTFFRMAEKLGFEREAFLPFAPNKPGFVERATDAVNALSQQSKHAAE
jgi:hypothetical protein